MGRSLRPRNQLFSERGRTRSGWMMSSVVVRSCPSSSARTESLGRITVVTVKMLVLSVQVRLYPLVCVNVTLTITITFTLTPTLILRSRGLGVYDEEGIVENRSDLCRLHYFDPNIDTQKQETLFPHIFSSVSSANYFHS